MEPTLSLSGCEHRHLTFTNSGKGTFLMDWQTREDIDHCLSPLMLRATLRRQQRFPLRRLLRSTLQPHLCQLGQVS